jgi:hypothetical protein
VCRFHETGEFGGRKKGDVARSPPPNDHGFLLVHDLIENAGQIFTEAGVRRFTRHDAPNWYCTVFLYGSGSGIRSDIKFMRRRPNLPPRGLGGYLSGRGTFPSVRVGDTTPRGRRGDTSSVLGSALWSANFMTGFLREGGPIGT